MDKLKETGWENDHNSYSPIDDLREMAAGPGLVNSAAMGPLRLVGVQLPLDWPPICGETGSAMLESATTGYYKDWNVWGFFPTLFLTSTYIS